MKSDPSFFVHARGVCDSTEVGVGTRIWANAHVMPEAKIGSYCNLGENVFVEQGVYIGNHCTIKNGVALWEGITIEDYAFIGPYAVFTNDFSPRAFHKDWKDRGFKPTLIQRGSTIGANATILCGISIGEFAMIGAGSVVTKDVEAHALVVGVPGRCIGRVCYCGKKLNSEDYCVSCKLPLAKNSIERIIKGSDEREKL